MSMSLPTNLCLTYPQILKKLPQKISRGLQFSNFFLSICKQLKKRLKQLHQTYICLLSCNTFHLYFYYSIFTVFCYCEGFYYIFMHCKILSLGFLQCLCQNSTLPLTQHHHTYLSFNEKSGLLAGSHLSLSLKLYLAVISKNFCAALKITQ